MHLEAYLTTSSEYRTALMNAAPHEAEKLPALKQMAQTDADSAQNTAQNFTARVQELNRLCNELNGSNLNVE